MHCIHTAGAGLCPACQEAFDEDPGAWLEYGDHEQGIANWKALLAELDAPRFPVDAATNAELILDRLDDEYIPF